MSVTDEFLSHNAAYASTFEGPLPLPPSKHVAVVACWIRGSTCIACSGSARARRMCSATRAGSSPRMGSARWH